MRFDVRLQARSKLYWIGIVMSLLLGLVIRWLAAAEYAGRVLVAFYLLGLGGTTYMFGASLVLLEKSAGTLQALRTTPLRSSTYIASKVLTLSAFAVVESGIVYAIGCWGLPVNAGVWLLSLTVLGFIYTLVGLGQVASHDSVTSFLFPGAVAVCMVLQLPALYLIDVGPAWLWYCVPSQGPLLLMLGAFEPLSVWQWIYAVGASVVFVLLAAWWANHRFARWIGLQEA